MICRQKVDIEFSWEPFLSHLFYNVTVVHMLFKYCSTVVHSFFVLILSIYAQDCKTILNNTSEHTHEQHISFSSSYVLLF